MVVLQLAIALCLTAFTAFSLWKRVVYMNYGTFRRMRSRGRIGSRLPFSSRRSWFGS
jgi:hypothetical protein